MATVLGERHMSSQALELEPGLGVGFKFGTQTAADNIIAAGKGAVEGNFYLTDAHRLYIGAYAGTYTGSQKDYTLYSINEGVVTVQNLTDLPVSDALTAEQRKASTGRFFYVTNENMLAVYNGKGYTLINDAANTAPVSITYSGTAGVNDVTLKETLGYGDNNDTVEGSFKIAGANGITVSWDAATTTLTITEDTMAIGAEAGAIDSNSAVLFVSDSTDTSKKKSSILIKGDKDTTVETDEDGNIVIATANTHNDELTIEPIQNGEGFKVQITDSATDDVSAIFNPYFRYGKKDENGNYSHSTTFTYDTLVKADGTTVPIGVANLDVYSQKDINNMLKSLNAMTYKGTIADANTDKLSATYSGGILVTNTNETYILDLDHSTRLKSQIGDFFVACNDVVYNGVTYLPGTMFICRGDEDADGFIEPRTLKLDIVASKLDQNSIYAFNRDTDQVNNPHSVILVNGQEDKVGKISFKVADLPQVTHIDGGTSTQVPATGANIHLDSEYADGDTQGDLLATDGMMTLKIRHDLVTRSDTDPTTITNDQDYSKNSDLIIKELTIEPIVGVTTDDTGHVTGVVKEKIKVFDTVSQLEDVDTETDGYTASEVNVGVIKNTVTLNDVAGNGQTKFDYTILASKSLQIKKDDTHGPTASSAAADLQDGLSIEMVWGSF